ncbi:oligoendopeptidase F [Mycoplasma iguanae]|uniref:Oligopeptidase F n=1 Tax=Mycoplasma iguanae TaxID=292461 RepID=A0ABY5R941_9MOLU|nr:oligoendopeptidase F [Mycoplasma iguanae]UVD81485.1 oligoendopeptidase F [Mycoplasma iguanae]
MKIYKKYDEIPERYRFDLDDLLKGQTIEELIEKWEKIRREINEVKDSKYDSSDAFLDYLKKEAEAEVLFNRIYNYISNNLNTNVVSPKFNSLYQIIFNKNAELEREAGSEINRIYKNAKKLKEWTKLKEFAVYKKNILDILESKKFALKPEVEEYLNSTSSGRPSLSNVFGIISDSETDYGFATDSKGKQHKITDGNFIKLLSSKDQNLRKSAYINYYKGQYKHRQSLTSLLLAHFKRISVDAKARKYHSAVQSLTWNDRVDDNLLTTIYTNVQDNMSLIHKFYETKAQFFTKKFGKKPQKWDHQLKLFNVKDTYKIEEAQKLVQEALKPLGKEYSSVVENAFKQRWVDYVNVENKRSGAYSIGASYGIDKIYILMNYDYTIKSVSTLAHEMGHSLHSYYSNKNQPQELSQYPIFLAEIASVFNQLMLMDYLLQNNKSDKLRFLLLEEAMTEFVGTIIRQIQWSNYEYELYSAMDKELPLNSFEDVEQLYERVIKKYLTNKDQQKLEKAKNKYENIRAVNVPHFYYSFYVYKYAVGYIAANAFFQKYKMHGKTALDDYINNFLSAGSSDWPVEILKKAGIDLYDKNIYQLAFGNFKSMLDEYISLGKKLFKNKK